MEILDWTGELKISRFQNNWAPHRAILGSPTSFMYGPYDLKMDTQRSGCLADRKIGITGIVSSGYWTTCAARDLANPSSVNG